MVINMQTMLPSLLFPQGLQSPHFNSIFETPQAEVVSNPFGDIRKIDKNSWSKTIFTLRAIEGREMSYFSRLKFDLTFDKQSMSVYFAVCRSSSVQIVCSKGDP